MTFVICGVLAQKIAAPITSVTSAPFLLLLIVNLILLFVGMMIDGIAAVIPISPILLPIAVNHDDIAPTGSPA